MASASTDAAEIRRRGRQRLIGAIAIVLLLVVFIPMLLDSEPRKSANEPPLDIPSKENAPPLPAPVPASAATTAAPDAAPSPTPPAASATPPGPSPAAEPASKADVKNPKEAKATEKAVAPAQAGAQSSSHRTPASAAVTTSPKLEGFAVQVGAFRDEAKLKHARDKLAAAGVPHYTERLDSATGGPLTRLRAGPFPTRQAADGAAAKLKAAQLPAQVVPLP